MERNVEMETAELTEQICEEPAEVVVENLLPQDENMENLENLRDELEKNYFVLKGLFSSKFSLINGLFEIIANGMTGAVFRIRVAASYYDDVIADIAVDLPWENFSSLISDKLLNRKIGINSLTHSLNDHFKKLCEQDFNFQVYESIKNAQFKELDSIVRREIRKVIKEEVKVELGYEVIDFDELNHKPKEDEKDDQKAQRVKMDDFTIYLQSELIVDPIKGKTASELQKGDCVYAYIREKTMAGLHIAEALGGLRNGQVRPVRSTIKKAEQMQNDPYNRLMLEVLFAPGIGGRSPISRELKLAIFEPVFLEDESADCSTNAGNTPAGNENILEITKQRQTFRERINSQNMVIFSLTMFIGFLVFLIIAIQFKK